ncbi:MAG: lytic murein transglycosylase [Spirochaetota bacterium]|nr:lytic murein transglycosylase [Spirochaetota bacterium]
MKFKKLLLLLIIKIFILSLTSFGLSKHQKRKIKFYDKVIVALSKVANKDEIIKLILNRNVRIRQKLIFINLNQPHQNAYFNNSLKRKYVLMGKRFLNKHLTTFKKVEKQYLVDREVILAILYVETNFKPAKAKVNVFNAYSSLMFADYPLFLKHNLIKLKRKLKRNNRKLTKAKFEVLFKMEEAKLIEKSKRKAEWATNELIALYKLSKKMKWHILNIKGSFAGAIGYPQFIPSSYLNYAVDGDNDNFVDLYNIKDSIASVANYLKAQGYQKDNLESQKNAIHHYNKSWDYVNFVLDYAKLLRKR